MARIVVFGLGRGADVATRYFRHDSNHEVVGYTVDDAYATRPEFLGRPVIPFSRIEREIPPADAQMFVPLGFQRMNGLRAEKYAAAKAKGYTLASYVSSRAVVCGTPRIGENCLILDANVLDYDVVVGNDVVMWAANHVGDLSVIEDHAWLSSHVVLSGEVTIGECAFLGVNATVSNRVKVGARCYVGANTLLAQDAAPDGVYVTKGTPRLAQVDSLRFLEMIGG